MQTVTDEIKNFLANSSGIRKMFEAGIELRKKYGDDKVYDFSLGNPDLPPPAEVGSATRKNRAQIQGAVFHRLYARTPDIRLSAGSSPGNFPPRQGVEITGFQCGCHLRCRQAGTMYFSARFFPPGMR